MPTEFVLCEHPDLPGQTARLPRSALARSDWRPVDNASPVPAGENTDGVAGASNPTENDEE